MEWRITFQSGTPVANWRIGSAATEWMDGWMYRVGQKNTPMVSRLYLDIGSKFSYQIHSVDSQLNYTQLCEIALIYLFNFKL
jgi:hypothetical protein